MRRSRRTDSSRCPTCRDSASSSTWTTSAARRAERSRDAIPLQRFLGEHHAVARCRGYHDVTIVDLETMREQVVHERIELDVCGLRHCRGEMNMDLGHEMRRDRETESTRGARDAQRL